MAEPWKPPEYAVPADKWKPPDFATPVEGYRPQPTEVQAPSLEPTGFLSGLTGAEHQVGPGAAIGRLARMPYDVLKAEASPPTTPGEEIAASFPGGLLAKRALIDPFMQLTEKAAAAPSLSEKVGYTAAAALPVIGPWAASMGERAGAGDISGAATELAVGATLPHTLPLAIPLVGRGIQRTGRFVEAHPSGIGATLGAGAGIATGLAGHEHPYGNLLFGATPFDIYYGTRMGEKFLPGVGRAMQRAGGKLTELGGGEPLPISPEPGPVVTPPAIGPGILATREAALAAEAPKVRIPRIGRGILATSEKELAAETPRVRPPKIQWPDRPGPPEPEGVPKVKAPPLQWTERPAVEEPTLITGEEAPTLRRPSAVRGKVILPGERIDPLARESAGSAAQATEVDLQRLAAAGDRSAVEELVRRRIPIGGKRLDYSKVPLPKE